MNQDNTGDSTNMITALMAQITALSNIEDDNKDLQAKLAERTFECDELKRKLADIQDHVISLKLQNEDLTNIMGDNANLRKEIEILKNDKMRKETQNNNQYPY